MARWVVLLILIRLHQVATSAGRVDQEVWVNPDAVAQLRPALQGQHTMVVFSTGTFIEVTGTVPQVAARLEQHVK